VTYEFCLGASAISAPTDSLYINLSSPILPDSAYIWTLIDSGSSHCFMSPKFIWKYNLWTSPTKPHKLWLFDGTSTAIVNSRILLPICFPTGETFKLDFLVTLIDASCSAILGYNWLTCYNPLVDWVRGSISFQMLEKDCEPILNPNQGLLHWIFNLLMQQCFL